VSDLEIDPATRGFHAVISGHSHKPGIIRREQVMFINAGSAGPRRFKLPVALARLQINGGKLRAKIITLEI